MEYERPKRKIVGQESTYSKEIIVFLNTMNDGLSKWDFQSQIFYVRNRRNFFPFFFSFQKINSGDHFLLKTFFSNFNFLNNFLSSPSACRTSGASKNRDYSQKWKLYPGLFSFLPLLLWFFDEFKKKNFDKFFDELFCQFL